MKLSVFLLVILGLGAFSEAHVSLTSHSVRYMNQTTDTSLCGTCNNFISNGIKPHFFF